MSESAARQPLFAPAPRTDVGPAAYAEPLFDYYARSGRPAVARIRTLLERWLDAYPADGRDELVGRLRGGDLSFQSAFFELYLHALLVALGHDVALHPALDGTAKRPDFLATPRADGPFSGGTPCIVEAVVATDESDDARVQRELQERLQDDINAFRHPDFFFVIARLTGRPARPPRRAAVHAFLREALDGLDADDLTRRITAREPVDRTLRRRFSHEGLVLELYPWPKSPPARGNPDHRSIGAGPVSVIRSTAREAIRDAIKRKAGRYGDLPYPYVVAVHCASRWGVEAEEVRHALLGSEQIVDPAGEAPRAVYSGEGAFAHRAQPTNTRVSAVLAVRDLSPHTVPTADVRLYHHLAPKRPYAGPLDVLPHARLVDRVLREFDGTAVPGNLFELPAGWPEPAADP